MKKKEFTPKFFTLLKEGFSKRQLTSDILAGIIVGIVALPLAIAFAVASGVTPEKGLITAVIAGFTISLLGGSRVQIGGPTGAFIVIVYGIVQEHGLAGLTIATFMAGFLMVAMGFARLGNYLRFVPYPLIVGFTGGIAVIIFSSQIKDMFGLQMRDVPADFIQKWTAYGPHFSNISWQALAISLGTTLITFNFYRISPRVPGSIVAIILSTIVVQLFHLPVETIESRYGEIAGTIPAPEFPAIDFATIQELLQPAIAIALLGSIESLLSAVVADGMMGGRHRPNMELVAQGTANVLSGLFGGIPATGAIARTATNIKSGGRSPVAGMVHAIVLLLIMIVLAPVARLIPLSCLAGILVVVAWHMGEWRNFFSLLRGNRMDVIVLLTTFFLTVFFDLILAIEIGMVLSGFIFMKRMSETTSVENAPISAADDEERYETTFEAELPDIPEGILLYEINGPLFFGAAQKFQEVLSDLKHKPRILILRMRHVPFIDATGIVHMKGLCRHLKKQGTTVLISGANNDIKHEFINAEMDAFIDRRNIHDHITKALHRAKEILGERS